MAINDHPYNQESFQYFAQSSMPDSTYERIPSFTVQDDAYMEEEDAEQNKVDGHIIGAFKECLEEIDIKGKELFKKLFSEGDVEIPLGRLARDAIGESRAKDFLGKMLVKVVEKMGVDQKEEGFVAADRGVDIDEELNQKLERFKVKTVNIGGPPVKDDKK